MFRHVLPKGKNSVTKMTKMTKMTKSSAPKSMIQVIATLYINSAIGVIKNIPFHNTVQTETTVYLL